MEARCRTAVVKQRAIQQIVHSELTGANIVQYIHLLNTIHTVQ